MYSMAILLRRKIAQKVAGRSAAVTHSVRQVKHISGDSKHVELASSLIMQPATGTSIVRRMVTTRAAAGI